MITDRSQEDVDRLLYLLSRYRAGEITDEERQEFAGNAKGAYNISDINRVGRALNYVNDMLTDIGYDLTIDSRHDWEMDEYFQTQDFQKYLRDVKKIRSAIAVFLETPETPEMEGFDYSGANAIEKILVDVDFLISQIAKNWFYSGEIYAGECNE